MAKSGIQIRGLRELIKALEQAGVEVQDLKDAFSKISAKAAQLATSFAPSRTGKLRGSIKGNKAKNKAVVRAGGARVPYAGPQNYGWPARNIRGQHFMQRADEAMRDEIVPMLEENINQILKDRGFQ